MLSLSFPTWQIHALCIIDWIIAIECIWNLAFYKKNKMFLMISNTLVLFLMSGICILNWHYYSNNLQLKWLIDFQAFLTLLGNLMCAIILTNIQKL